MQTVNGATVPFFVMELVPDAAPLTDYATARAMSPRAKVALFQKVCNAVAYGHHRGVIHRDLKPGNILVGPAGEPKVIDYGVARSTDSDIALTTMHTDVGHLVGTLQYMSPEQFDADPDEIDTRADVYALGVVLYELLTGRPPYDVAKKPVFEAARLVRERVPTPLSSFNRTLRGDLDTIVAKCLEKDRSSRYSTAAELEADLGRYLAGEPIAATPPSLFAALSRLGRRHRTAFTVAATGLAALVVTTTGIGLFAMRAQRERAEALVARDYATAQEVVAARERDRSQRLVSFLLDAIRNTDAYAPGRCRQTCCKPSARCSSTMAATPRQCPCSSRRSPSGSGMLPPASPGTRTGTRTGSPVRSRRSAASMRRPDGTKRPRPASNGRSTSANGSMASAISGRLDFSARLAALPTYAVMPRGRRRSFGDSWRSTVAPSAIGTSSRHPP
jgi:hypothetical protein